MEDPDQVGPMSPGDQMKFVHGRDELSAQNRNSDLERDEFGLQLSVSDKKRSELSGGKFELASGLGEDKEVDRSESKEQHRGPFVVETPQSSTNDS